MVHKLKIDQLKLSILDFVHVYKGNSATESLKNSTETIQLAEKLGFTRYWFTEHHNTSNQVSTSPDLLSIHAAANTKTIRVGAGGIMLPNYSPLKVAENFTLLEALHPGRIDLGVGRASGTDGLTALALQRSREVVYANDFPEQLGQLVSYFARDFAEEHPFKTIKVPGDVTLTPDMFMLGSSQGGVQFAFEKGLGFVFAAHLAPHLAIPVLKAYRQHFKPSANLKEPQSILAIGVIVAKTEEEAKYLAGPVELMWARIGSGSSDISFPTVEEAYEHPYSPREEQTRLSNQARFVIGSVEQVAQKLREMANEAQVDEIMIADFYPTQESRLKGHRLLADQFELMPTENKIIEN